MTVEMVGRIPEFTQGDRLRKARQLTGMNTREFAKEIGVSQKSITDAECDKVKPRRITLMAYSMRTGVPLEWLETGKNPNHSGPGEKLPRLDSNQEPAAASTSLIFLAEKAQSDSYPAPRTCTLAKTS